MAYSQIIEQLEQVISERRSVSADRSYVATLCAKGRQKIAQKVGEEAVELVIAATADNKKEVVAESADLLFHWLVLLADADINVSEVLVELERREGISGLEEKSRRQE